jgi:dihydrofolate reductase
LRKVIVVNCVSLDGFFSRPNGMPPDLRSTGTEFDDDNVERARQADTLLLGRTSFVGFRNVFGTIPDGPDPEPPNGLFAEVFAPLAKVVVSDSLPEQLEGPWADATVVRRASAHAHVAALRQGEGRDILILASHLLWNDLLAHGLVDELHLTISAEVFGEGVPLFTGASKSRLRLLEVTPYPGRDAVKLRYAAGGA